VLFSQPIKHNNLPSPPPGRGAGEGAKKPASPSLTLQGHRESSTLVHCPCGAWLGRFTPHPLPLSPSRGEGEPVLFSQPIKHNNLPTPPPGERGGGEGAKKPASPSSTLQGHRESSTLVRCPCRRVAGAFHPSPPTPLPFQGRGGPVLFSQPIKHNNLPSPPPGERGGVRGQRNLPVPRQPFRDTVNPALSCTVRAARGWALHPSPPTPLPFQERGGQCSFHNQ
jgi:hypothetical protein